MGGAKRNRPYTLHDYITTSDIDMNTMSCIVIIMYAIVLNLTLMHHNNISAEVL